MLKTPHKISTISVCFAFKLNTIISAVAQRQRTKGVKSELSKSFILLLFNDYKTNIVFFLIHKQKINFFCLDLNIFIIKFVIIGTRARE